MDMQHGGMGMEHEHVAWTSRIVMQNGLKLWRHGHEAWRYEHAGCRWNAAWAQTA